MLAAALIVFREVLEAMLIISVVLAATKGVAQRLMHVLGGVGAGLAGSFLVAFFTGEITAAFEGNGQEYFQALIMFTVTGLLTWHIVWMQSHGRTMIDEMKRVGAQVVAGQKSMMVLAGVVALAVWREGSEVVLFMQGMLSSHDSASILAGFTIGALGGLLVGAALYLGLVKMRVGVMFAATNILLTLIAAGMAARGAGKLIQMGALPPLVDPLWDTSAIVSEDSFIGSFMTALTGYIAQPSAMQLIFYATTVVLIVVMMIVQKKVVQKI